MRKKIVTVKEIQNLDKVAIEKYGIPSLCLMENAGKSVAQEVLKRIKSKKKPKVGIFCGPGNNAGDGFVIARHLINAGIKTNIFLIGRGNQLKNDAAVNYNILKRLKYPMIENVGATDRPPVREIKKSDIIVDAIFGVGLNRNLCEPYFSVIEEINKNSKKIVSVDIPSGLDGTDGRIYGVCVKADVTVTFTCLKKGFFKGHGPKQVGKMVVVDIGIPLVLQERIAR